MAEILVLAGLLSPIALMLWLTWARRRAQAKVAAQATASRQRNSFATEEAMPGAPGERLARQHFADHELAPPDTTGGEPAGIRALQGRR